MGRWCEALNRLEVQESTKCSCQDNHSAQILFTDLCSFYRCPKGQARAPFFKLLIYRNG